MTLVSDDTYWRLYWCEDTDDHNDHDNHDCDDQDDHDDHEIGWKKINWMTMDENGWQWMKIDKIHDNE